MARDDAAAAAGSDTKSTIVERVLDAIANLGEKNGSSTKNILSYVRMNGKASDRNLTVQIRRALKHGLSEGLIKLRGGRYKMCQPKVVPAPPPKKRGGSVETGGGGGSAAHPAPEDSRKNSRPSRSSRMSSSQPTGTTSRKHLAAKEASRQSKNAKPPRGSKANAKPAQKPRGRPKKYTSPAKALPSSAKSVKGKKSSKRDSSSKGPGKKK